MNELYFQAIHQIITTGHWITDEVTKSLKEFGMTEPQYNVLRILKHANGKPISVGRILEQMVQRSSNITRIVDKLVKKDLAVRTECPSNRRKMDIVITAAGKSVLTQLDKNVLAFHKSYLNNLSSEELETLKTLVQKLKS
jgi:DNA-binding MarR family transcriptional regulator